MTACIALTGSSAVQAIPIIAQQAKALTVFQRTAAYAAAPAHNAALDREFEARVKADYAGFRARNRRMHGGFGTLLPPNPVWALAVSAQEREAMFEERWRVGGFAILGAVKDLLPRSSSPRDSRPSRPKPSSCSACVGAGANVLSFGRFQNAVALALDQNGLDVVQQAVRFVVNSVAPRS